MTLILWIALGCVAALFAWSTIHEASHYIVARRRVGAELLSFKPWPHRVDGRWVFGYTTYRLGSTPTEADIAAIMLAPRWADGVAAIALPFCAEFIPMGPWWWVGVIFAGGGVVDLAYGSIGLSEHSDLRRGAAALRWPPRALRIYGWFAVMASVMFTARAIWL